MNTEPWMLANIQPTFLARYIRLIEIGKDLSSTLDLEKLTEAIVETAAELSEAACTTLLLYDDHKQELYYQAAKNAAIPRGLIVPVDHSIAGWIVTHHEPLRIDNLQADKRFKETMKDVVNIPAVTLLGVPLFHKDRLIGALVAINKQDGVFTVQDQEILMALGNQAAVAIENSRLFLQLDLIDEFVHEIRTPLSSITAAAQLLNHPQVTPDKHKKLSKAIIQESERLNEMASSFLDLARLESGRYRFDFRRLNIAQLLDECTNLVEGTAMEMGISLNLSIHQDIPDIYGDYDKIKQMVINLLSNAIKYNTPGGKVEIQATAAYGKIKIVIQDTGIGISEELQPNLFQKFYRVPGSEKFSPGTGLGLSIVKRILEGHQGEISVTSEKGSGTSFTILLPQA
jgi:signal transduction histidine kinase